MASLYWIEDALQGILPTLWMTFGVGLPWAYALLATKHWHSRTMLTAVSLAIGPAWVTAWMLFLGVLGAQLNHRLFIPEWILGGTLIITIVGIVIAWQKRKSFTTKAREQQPLLFDEKLIIGMIVIAVIIRWIHTAFWTFTAYDALWVYGFQARLYFLEGFIPHSIDYYPQFVQLQYTYVQILIGEINDHAARMIIPMMHIGSILATYLLGKRLFNRRAGLFAAALWCLHPYVGQWSFIGDLEIPLTFSFTMAATFFLSAWMEKEEPLIRRQYALLAGLMLGIALYTKPTAGALIWGVVLLVVVELVRVRFRIQLWLPRFMVAFWTGLACIPLGGIWYIRNIILGHDAITFPPDLWLSLARRSADHLNWILLAIVLAFVAFSMLRKLSIRQFMIGLFGIILLLIGSFPSNPIITPTRFDPPLSYITLLEAGFILAGFMLISFSLFSLLRRSNAHLGVLTWGTLLALPYFVTWFYSYSYHYRLGFAIVPLLILPTAVILSKWFAPNRLIQWSSKLKTIYFAILIVLGIPGIISVAVDVTWSKVWLTSPDLDSDIRKYQVFNPSLMEIYFAISEYIAVEEDYPIIVAPGEQRLHFFFPKMPIFDLKLTTLNEYEALDATHFLYGAQARWAYERAGINPTETQLISALGRPDYFERVRYHIDATFRYELYWSEKPENRFRKPRSSGYPILYNDTDVLFGDSLRFRAFGVSPIHFHESEKILLTASWQAIQPIRTDYQFVYQIYNPEEPDLNYQWFLHPASFEHGYYSPTVWDVYESVEEERFVTIAERSKLEPGKNYQIRVRVYDPKNNRFLPVYIDGQWAGEYFKVEGTYRFGTLAQNQ